ncbi:MAG: efflux RND transporter periplasmic adaptor subunit [Candidatus Atribacteria bacterium]|nr:efflux RND transporter periplasmic adaptor subunit [Candidatus Atribacteria bacterium]
MSKKVKKIIIPLIILSVAIIAIWLISFNNKLTASQKENDLIYKTIPVEKGSISNSISVVGTAESLTRAEVKSEIGEKVVQIFVKSGDLVTINQPLFQLDTRELEISRQKIESQLISAQAELDKLLQQPSEVDLKQAEANYQEALIALENAQRTLERHRELFASGGLSKEQLEQSEDQVILKEQAVYVSKAQLDDLKKQPKKEDVEIRRAQISEVKASLESIKNQLEASLIKSPISGTVIDVNVKVGDIIQTGSATTTNITATIDDMSTMKVVVPINEIDVPRIQEGMKARVVLDALPDKPFNGKVDSISYLGKITENVVTYDATILIPNPDRIIRPEMTAEAEITTEYKENATIIPLDALIEKKGKSFVLIANQEGEPIEREVKVGIRNGDQVEIIEGIETGELVVLPSITTHHNTPPVMGGTFGGGGR